MFEKKSGAHLLLLLWPLFLMEFKYYDLCKTGCQHFMRILCGVQLRRFGLVAPKLLLNSPHLLYYHFILN